jgi:serine/threonine protein kinase/tetratricopeptide (TPR) repeat protein
MRAIGNFEGNERFEIVRQIGAGGMGVVYEAFDRERRMRVALKTLPQILPHSLYLFKSEFRSLAGFSHPNLVTLYELLNQDDHWFFTMQYIEGVDFRSYVTGVRQPGTPVPLETELRVDAPTENMRETATITQVSGAPIRKNDYGRLREALAQVVAGLSALHAESKLHRDVKPSNVLVTTQGRAVLLDFGLVQEFKPDVKATHLFAGSAAYMSPEQATGQRLTPMSDWYSVGVVLYEALAGRLPHGGSLHELLFHKQSVDPEPPSTIKPSVPRDLNDLCVRLLDRDPERRPDAGEILRVLAGDPAFSSPKETAAAQPEKRILVGRKDELAMLGQAFDQMRAGATVVVRIEGASGVGKSTLVRESTEQMRSSGEAAVMVGRCYEQESVPFKALDGLMDGLTSYLRQLPETDVAALMPRDAGLLTAMFPVMGRLTAVASASFRPSEALQRQEVRRRTFQAIRELLARLGDRTPLVLAIDDLQWGDSDSADLLAEALRQPDGPALLLLVAYRSEYVERSAPLRALLAALEGQSVARHHIALGALGRQETKDLAEQLLARAGIRNPDLIDSIIAESQGVAYFVRELVQNAAEDRVTSGAFDLQTVILNRVRTLADEPRALLEVIAVAGRPIAQSDAYAAAGILENDPACLALLRSMRLVRTSGNALTDDVETYHDRIRESVAASLAPDVLRHRHRNLAKALEDSSRGGPEAVAVHLELGGEPEKAALYYRRAAEAAGAALAFDKAVKLYARALELTSQESKERPELSELLADAQANAGFSLEAAERYQKLSAMPGFESRSDLARKAAYQFCICGHAREGTEAFQDVLRRAGLRMPRSPWIAVAGRIALLIWIRLRGDRLATPRAGADLARNLEAIDVAQFISLGLSAINPYSGTYFSALAVALALRAGEPGRASKALAWEAVVTAAFSGGRARAEHLLRRCQEIAASVDSPLNRAFLKMARAMVPYELGQFASAKQLLEDAESALSECSGVNFELNATRTYRLWSLVSLGHCGELAAITPLWFRDALSRGDAFTAANVGAQPYVLGLLGQDEPDRAIAIHEQSMSLWPAQEYTLQKMMAGLGRGWIDLYIDDAEASWRDANDHWRRARRVFLHLLENIPAYMLHWRALSALAMAEKARKSGGDESAFLRAAERDAAKLRRLTLAHGPAMGEAILAGVAEFRADRNGAVEHLQSAMQTFEALSMVTMAEIARRELGRVKGGEEGAAMIRSAEEKLRSFGVRDPDAMRRVFLRGAGVL